MLNNKREFLYCRNLNAVKIVLRKMEKKIKFTRTKEALTFFMECLKCKKCKNLAVDPVRLVNCSHFFCTKCISKQKSTCFTCGVPVQPNEIQIDFLVTNLIKSSIDLYNILNAREYKKDKENIEKESKSNNNTKDEERRCVSPSKSSLTSKTTDTTFLESQDGNEIALSKREIMNLNKPNRKGETPLHTACVKGNEKRVKALLNAGANPNTKDHARLTPLQEAASYGFYEICKLLLQAGARPDTPGSSNKTALHETVIRDLCKEAELLLQFGASKTCRDESGKTPEDYCTSDEMQKVLSSAEENADKTLDNNKTLNTTVISVLSNHTNQLTVLPINLTKYNNKLLQEAAIKHNINIVTSFKDYVSYIVVEANDDYSIDLNYDICLAILHGKWFLSSEWIHLLLDMEEASAIDLELFELRCIARSYGTPVKARKNFEKQNPRLFNNCHFYFALNNKTKYCVGPLILTKEDIIKLAIEGEGNILKREPRTDDVRNNQCVPFHVANNPDHPLHKCTYYIIYEPGKDEPRIKYNMKNIKTLPLLWFVESVEKFQLMNPVNYGL